jgi:hypothetical protein
MHKNKVSGLPHQQQKNVWSRSETISRFLSLPASPPHPSIHTRTHTHHHHHHHLFSFVSFSHTHNHGPSLRTARARGCAPQARQPLLLILGKHPSMRMQRGAAAARLAQGAESRAPAWAGVGVFRVNKLSVLTQASTDSKYFSTPHPTEYEKGATAGRDPPSSPLLSLSPRRRAAHVWGPGRSCVPLASPPLRALGCFPGPSSPRAAGLALGPLSLSHLSCAPSRLVARAVVVVAAAVVAVVVVVVSALALSPRCLAAPLHTDSHTSRGGERVSHDVPHHSPDARAE